MKKTVFWAGILVATMTLFSLGAADDPGSNDSSFGGPESRRSGGRRFGSGPGGMRHRDPRAEAEAQIKAKFPKEYAEIEKLRAEADAKLQALAKKAGVELPRTFAEQVAELKAKFPKETAEIEALQKTDRRTAFRKMRELAEKAGIRLSFGRPGGMGMNGGPGFGSPNRDGGNGDAEQSPAPRRNPVMLLHELERKYPKEMAEFRKLRETDPDAARAKIRQLIDKLNAEKAAEKTVGKSAEKTAETQK